MSKWVYGDLALFVVFIAIGVVLCQNFPELAYRRAPLQVLYATLAAVPPMLCLFENLRTKRRKAVLYGTAFLMVNPILAWQLCYTIIAGNARTGTLGD